MKKFWRAAGLAAGGAAALALLTVGGYGLFLEAHYYRIPDGTALAVENGREDLLQVGETYTALTFNIGFGAYDPDFSFFMDSGRMADGEEVTGRYGKGRSAEAVAENTARSWTNFTTVLAGWTFTSTMWRGRSMWRTQPGNLPLSWRLA